MQGFSRGGDLAADRRRRRAGHRRSRMGRSSTIASNERRAADDGLRPDRRLGRNPGTKIIYVASSTRSASERTRYDPPAITVRPSAISSRRDRGDDGTRSREVES